MNSAEAGVVGAEADEKAFRALCVKAVPEVYSYVLHRCGGCVPVAEDLTSDVMVAAVAEFRSQGRSVDMAWLIGVARNKLLDHWRRQEREERRLRLFWGGAAQDEDDLGAWEGDEARARALAALGRVPVAQRAALTLRYLDGLSVPGVASRLGRSVHATESLLARGRRAFRRLYLERADD
jgi:RNA polymerase sigma-70 factor (ECF subfamily)